MARQAESCIGQIFGEMTAVEEWTEVFNTRKRRMVKCLCSCGNISVVQKGSLKNGSTLSCGCLRRKCSLKFGEKFNKLTAASEPFKLEGSDLYYAKFKCECGNEKTLIVQNVKAGKTLSCGCIKALNKSIKGTQVFSIDEKYHKEICESYKNGESTYSLAAKFSSSKDTISRLLKMYGIEIKSKFDRHISGQRDHIDRSRFSDLSCPETAYFYGLLLSDGHMDGTSVRLALKLEDGYMVRELHSWLNAKTKVTDRHRKDSRTGKIYSITEMYFSDKVITDNLRVLGFCERKSTIEVVPLTFSFNKDFWRGVLDGDGHISRDSNTVGICGSFEVCSAFKVFAESLGIKFSQKIKLNGKLHTLNLTGKENCKLLLDILYQDSNLYLKRKHSNYLFRYYNLKDNYAID